MTEIKCRYNAVCCAIGQEEVEYYSDIWWCDSDDQCPEYRRPWNSDEKLCNPRCEYCRDRFVEFAKSVKQYSLVQGIHGGCLEFGRTSIDIDLISYLEIDGRILINREAENE